MRITSKGQVTIPHEIREHFGFQPHTEVAFQVEGDAVVLRKVEGAPVRSNTLAGRTRGTATVNMSTDEILALMR